MRKNYPRRGIGELSKTAEYIERDEAKNYIKNSDLSNQEKIACLCAINSISTESVAPVYRGEWKMVSEFAWGDRYECTICHTTTEIYSKFCPGCGAAMTVEAVEMVMERIEELYETT